MNIIKGIILGALTTPISSLLFVMLSLFFISPPVSGITGIIELIMMTIVYSLYASFYVALILTIIATPILLTLTLCRLNSVFTGIILSLAPAIIASISSNPEDLYFARLFGWVSLVAGLTFWYHASRGIYQYLEKP